MAPIEHDPNPVDTLADEFVRRYRNGETPSISEYTERYPQLADEIRELFPSVVMMERLKRSKRDEEQSARLPQAKALEEPKRKKLGDYRIIREIGRGGMGIVYEAEQISLRRCVALKILPHQITSERRLKRFRREAKAAARLHHTNIVPVFGVGQHKGIHYYVMQYIRGQCLDAVLDALAICDEQTHSSDHDADSLPMAEAFRMAESLKSGLFGPEADAPPICVPTADTTASGIFSGTDTATLVDSPVPLATQSAMRASNRDPYWQNVASIGLQVARALAYAHDQGVLHRDIKPANLIMDWQGRVWVTDFGLAKVTENDDITLPGDVVGTVRYMAPERFSGTCDEKSEIYSLGLALYEFATLQPAFHQSDRGSLIQAITESAPTRPSSIVPNIPRDLETIIQKTIAREPHRRYASAADLAEDLQRFLDDRAILARRTSRLEHLWRWTRRNPVTAASMTLVILLLLAIAVISSTGYYVRTRTLAKIREQKRELQAQGDKLTAQNQQLVAAGQATAQARASAEKNLNFALQAFREILQRIARPENAIIDLSLQDWESFPLQTNVTEKDAVLLESLLKFYEKLEQQNDTDLQPEQARTHQLVGDIYQQIGQFNDALKAYRLAARTYRLLARQKPMYNIQVAKSRNQRGIVFRRQHKLEAARSEHRQALNTLRHAPAATRREPACQFEIAQSYANLAKASAMMSRPQSSKGISARREMMQSQDEAKNILNNLVQTDPSEPEYRLALARIYRDVPYLGRKRPKRPSRQEMLAMQQAIQPATELLQRLLKEHPDNPLYKFELAQTYAVPYLSRLMGSDRIPMKDLERAIELLSELARLYPNVPDYKASKLRCQLSLGRMKWRRGDRTEARDLFNKSLSLHSELASATGGRGHFLMLIVDIHRFAEERFRSKDFTEAQRILESTLGHLKTSLTTLPKSRFALRRNNGRDFLQQRLVQCYKLLSRVYVAQGKPQLARRNDEEARRIEVSLPRRRRPPDRLDSP